MMRIISLRLASDLGPNFCAPPYIKFYLFEHLREIKNKLSLRFELTPHGIILI